jgi:hypothetical protein
LPSDALEVFRLVSLPRIGRKASTPLICSRAIYDWFTEGFDTLDLKETKALFDELAS